MNIVQSGVKAFVWALLRFLYRVRVKNTARIPTEGAAVLIPNHVSFLDAMLIAAHIGRPVHYAMHWRYYQALKWIVAPMGAFPIAAKTENETIYWRAMQHIGDVLDAGELLCIFPEGKITTTGRMNEFRPGILRILERNPVPVVPVGLRGLWGTYFSKKKRGLFKLPDHWMAKIEMHVGEPLPPTTRLDLLEFEVYRLSHTM